MTIRNMTFPSGLLATAVGRIQGLPNAIGVSCNDVPDEADLLAMRYFLRAPRGLTAEQRGSCPPALAGLAARINKEMRELRGFTGYASIENEVKDTQALLAAILEHRAELVRLLTPEPPKPEADPPASASA